MENFNAPNLSKFANLLIDEYRYFELVPLELTGDEHTCEVILIPSRDGQKFDCDFINIDSLPRLNLKEAGIDTNQRPEKMFLEARELLRDRKFFAEPVFHFLKALLAVEEIARFFDCLEMSAELKESHWALRQSTDTDHTKKVAGHIKDYYIEFSLGIKGGPIKGLDVSKNVEGFMPAVIAFLMPSKVLHNDPIKLQTVWVIKDFFNGTKELGKLESEYQQYLAENSNRWWFPYFNSKERWEKEIDSYKRALKEFSAELNRLLTELKCN